MASTDSEKTLKKIAFDSVEQEAYLQLWRTYDRLREVETKTFEPHGITAQQYNVLRILQSVKAEYLPTTTLASRLVSRSPDMTRMLDKLEAKGLISRRRGVENRRIVEVALTQLGAKLIAQIASDVRLCSREQLGHLGTQKLRQLIALLVEARRTHEDDSATEAWPSYRSQ